MPEAPPIIPGMPYTVVELEFGPFKRPTRLYPNGHYGDILTDDELATWRVVQGLANVPPPASPEVDPVLTAAVAEYAAGEAPATKPPKKRR